MVQVNFYPTEDAYVDTSKSSTNTGGQGSLWMGRTSSGTIFEPFMKFDLSSIPSNAIINSASINIYGQSYNSLNPETFGFYAVLSSWGETTLTWNNKPSTEGSYGGSFSVASGEDPIGLLYSAYITSIVQRWVNGTLGNYGISGKGVNNSYGTARIFNSREQQNGKPFLQVNYSFAPTTPTGITHSSGELKGGQTVGFTASGSTDPDGDFSSYEYQYSYDNATWVNFTSTFTILTDAAKTTLYIRARAKDSTSKYSAYYTKSFTVVQNTAPSITGTNSSLGTITTAPSITYQVSDVDAGDVVTIVEKVDSTVLKSFTATQNTDYQLTFTPLQWLKVPQGAHTLSIEATDINGAKTVRTHTFTRAETQMDFEVKTPFTIDKAARRILITLEGTLPEGIVAKIEVCNNAFDAIPTWEDATSMVLQGLPYPFENTTKTEVEWGVSFKVHIERGTAVGDVYLDRIGGAFD